MGIQLKVRNRWQEKRRHQRIPFNTEVEIATGSKLFGFLFARRPQFRAQSKDRSAGGLRVISERHLRIGTAVQLWVVVQCRSKAKTIKLRGEVVSSTINQANMCIAGIRLRSRPGKAMHLWIHDVAESRRRLDGG